MDEVTVSVADVVFAQTALKDFAELELPAVVTWKVIGWIDAVNAEFQRYEKTRLELVNRYGKPQQDGTVQVNPEDKQNHYKFVADINTLLNNTVTLHGDLLKRGELAGVSVSPRTIIGIRFLFPEEPNHDGSNHRETDDEQ